MILRATIPPRPALDESEICVDPDCHWNGETTGSVIEMDAAPFAEKLRTLIELELQMAKHGGGEDLRERLVRSPRFRNQAVLTLWLDQQIKGCKSIVELSDFPCVAQYPDDWKDLILIYPTGVSHGGWSTCLGNARCPACGITYGASDLREIEHDFFFYGEYVLTCPRHHHLIIVGSQSYQLGG